MDSGNGILGAVPGECISAGAKLLPDPTDRTASEVVEVDAQHLGRVRITYRPHRYKRHKSSWWAWLAEHAEKASTPPPAPSAPR